MRAASASLLVVIVSGAVAGSAEAQQPATQLTPPQNIVLPNVNGVPIGPFGGLEAGAYAARVADPSASWFNPAGLSRTTTAELSGNAGLYQFTTITPTALSNTGGGLQQLPNLVGFSVHTRGTCTFGLSILTTNAWDQETNAELINGNAANGERFAYSADAEFSRRNVNFSGGCLHGRWRLGGGLSFAFTDLKLVDTASDRVSNASGLGTVLISSRREGSAMQLRPLFGVQYDPTATWRLGVVVRTPAATLHRTGEIAVDGTLQTSGASQGVSLFDAEATFNSKLPWEVQGGVGYVGPRAQLEIDVQAFTGPSAYAMLAGGSPVVTYTGAGPGVTPSIVTQPFNGLTSSPRGIANVAIGGHYQVWKHHSYLLHGGFTTDLSPVNSDDEVFDQINMYGWTVGMSGQTGKLQFSGGLNFRSGTATDAIVRDLLSGQRLTTQVKVHTTAFIYSISYQF